MHAYIHTYILTYIYIHTHIHKAKKESELVAAAKEDAEFKAVLQSGGLPQPPKGGTIFFYTCMYTHKHTHTTHKHT
jgi:hypothetical protein